MSTLPLPEGVPGVPPGAATAAKLALSFFGKKNDEPPPGYRATNWVSLKRDAGGFSIGSSEVPDMAGLSEAQRNAIVLPYLERLHQDYDAERLAQYVGQQWTGPPGTSWRELAAKLFAAIEPARKGGAQLMNQVADAGRLVQAYSYLNPSTGQRIDVAPNAPVPGGFQRIGVTYMDAQNKQDGAPSNSGAVPVPQAGGLGGAAGMVVVGVLLLALAWAFSGKGKG